MMRLGCVVSLIGLRGNVAAAQKAGWSGPVALWDGSMRGLLRVVDDERPDWLWVQFSGYGYSKLGSPWRLAVAIRLAKKRRPSLRLAVCVQETYCKPSQLGLKGILLSPWQKVINGTVVRCGDLVFPTIPVRMETCVNEFGAKPNSVKLLPIASNILRLQATRREREGWRAELGFSSSHNIAVIFGVWASQLRALEEFESILESKFERGEIDHVVAIGGDTVRRPPWAKDLLKHEPWKSRLTILGHQPAERIAQVIASADIGLVPTPWLYWEKSGAARAFQQAGLSLWFIENGDLRQLPPNQDPVPTWDDLAEKAISELYHFEKEEA